VLGRLEQHPLQADAVGLLEVGLAGDRDASGVQALGQLVARLLQLAEAEDPRSGPRALRGRLQPAHRKRGDERVGQLTLEPLDLPSQRAPGGQLVRLGDGWHPHRRGQL